MIDQKAAAVARGLQTLGILLCIAHGIPLNRCPSFIDLALFETKERAKTILASALGDWATDAGAVATHWTSGWSLPNGATSPPPADGQPARVHLPRR
jgi:hypothetical protein